MSEVAQVALITGGIPLQMLLANLKFNLRSESSRRDERKSERDDDYRVWYRHTLFEKRLQTIQEAYAWMPRFNTAIAIVRDPKVDEPETARMAPDNEHLIVLANGARRWYNENALYFKDGLPGASMVIGLTNVAIQHAHGQTFVTKDIWQFFNDADSAIRQRAEQLMATQEDGRE